MTPGLRRPLARSGLRARAAGSLLASCAFAAPGGGQPPEPPPGPPAGIRASATVVSEPVEVGAGFELEVVVEHPPDAEAAPVLAEALGDFRVLGAERTAPPDGAEAPGGSRFTVRLLAGVLPGDHEIPAAPVGIRLAGGELRQVEAPPTPVRVVSSLPPEDGERAADIHDLRGPFLFDAPPRWGVIGGALLAAALLAAALYRFLRRRRGSRGEETVPLPPPAAEAEAALARLGQSGLLAAGQVVPFYERLAAIMKRYAGRRFETAWSERTTGEILADLDARLGGRAGEALPLLAGILAEADLAKFSDSRFRDSRFSDSRFGDSRFRPEAAEGRFADAGRFLDRTRPSLAEPPAEPGEASGRPAPPIGPPSGPPPANPTPAPAADRDFARPPEGGASG